MQEFSVTEPTARITVYQLGQKLQCRLAGLQQVLTLRVAAPTLAGDGCQLRGLMLRLARHRAFGDVTRMLCLVAPGDDTDVVAVQKQRPGHADRLRGHGVAAPVVTHLGGH